MDEKTDQSAEAAKKGLVFRLKSFFGQEYFKKPMVFWMIAAGFFVNVAHFVFLIVFIKPLDLPIILHYNVYFGVDMFGDWKMAYLLPLIGLFIILTNISLSVYFFRKKERIASYLLLTGNLIVQSLLAVASASVILINY